MQIIKNNKLKLDKNIYEKQHYLVITANKFWDGGIRKEAVLKEKAEFYVLANEFSDIVKKIALAFDDTILTGSSICERETIFEFWKDKKRYDCFYNLSEYFKDGKLYELTMPEDNEYIDYIIENNFRYLTCFDLLIPKEKIILKPTCHTEIFIYACNDNYDEIKEVIGDVVSKYELISLKEFK